MYVCMYIFKHNYVKLINKYDIYLNYLKKMIIYL